MRTIRVVLDTNVVISAHLNRDGFECHVLDLILVRKLHLATTAEILQEYENVLRRPKFALNHKEITRSIRLLRSQARMFRPPRELAITSDPDDNCFLECADAARADYLVTGNKRHFPKTWRQTLVVNARELVEAIAADLRR